MRGSFILSTYPDEKSAEEAAKMAVTGRLAACVNILKVRSIYTWGGRLEEADEYLTLFKTAESKIEALKTAIEAGHPYEVPEVVELPMATVNVKYLEWMIRSVGVDQPM